MTSHEIAIGYWQAELRCQFFRLEPTITNNGFKWVFCEFTPTYPELKERFGDHVWLNDWMANMHDPVENPRFGIGHGGTMGTTNWIAFKHDSDAIEFKLAYGSNQWTR